MPNAHIALYVTDLWRVARRRLDFSAGPNDCWLVATSNRSGYAIVNVGNTSTTAHRVAWSAANGQEIPAGYQVHHTCEVRNCVNPEHLALMTAADHTRLHRPKRTADTPPAGECRHGHVWEVNAHMNSQGCWICRVCQREATRRAQQRRAA